MHPFQNLQGNESRELLERAGQGNGLGTSEAIALRGNCSELPSCRNRADLSLGNGIIFLVMERGDPDWSPFSN